jgi:DNA (cytosine-5)-methyltransferase 1
MIRFRWSGVRVSAIGTTILSCNFASVLGISLMTMSTAVNVDKSLRNSSPRRPLAVDLFAGAGGLSLGLEQAGFDVAAAVEYDPVHAATHEFNFPHTEVLCADVSAPLTALQINAAVRKGMAAHGHDVDSWDGELDLVAGGPPCQGFSFIGKRLLDDKRNQLVFHFFRLVRELRPRYFVMENVPGMAKGGHASILGKLIDEFESVGYRFPTEHKYRILNAANFGVPQDRLRLFLIGTRDDQETLAEPPSPTVRPVPKRVGERDREAELFNGPTVMDAIGDLPNLNLFPTLLKSDEVKLSARRLASCEEAASSYARSMRNPASDTDDFSHPRTWDPDRLTSSMRTVHSFKSTSRFRRTLPGHTEPISRYYKLDAGGLSNTLRAGSGSERGAFTSPRPVHPASPRVLSNREAARLHSFPDWFRLHATKWHGFRQIGNAVAPLVGRAVGKEVVRALGIEPERPEQQFELGAVELLWLNMSAAAVRYGAVKSALPEPRRRKVIDDPPGASVLIPPLARVA